MTNETSVVDDPRIVGYLHQIDIVRLLTFASVIGVHAVAQAITGDNVAGNGAEVVLHFTRDAFFTLTGFVLFHTNYNRPLSLKKFWTRRFPVVLIPYWVWSTIYFLLWLNNNNNVSNGFALRRYGYDLLTGAASYHLYFLLVSMQIYALFPVFRWIVQKTTGFHWVLFMGLVILDGLFTAWLHFASHGGAVLTFTVNCQELVITYLVFVFAGALAAVHLAQFQHWMRRHSAPVIMFFVGGLAVAQVAYHWQVNHGRAANDAADPLQPSIMLWSLAVVLVLYLIGLQWADHRRPGRVANVVSEASRASFGVYLVHPLMLTFAANLHFSYRFNTFSPVVAALGGWVIAVVLSAVFVEVFLRTPLAMPLTGRHRS